MRRTAMRDFVREKPAFCLMPAEQIEKEQQKVRWDGRNGHSVATAKIAQKEPQKKTAQSAGNYDEEGIWDGIGVVVAGDSRLKILPFGSRRPSHFPHLQIGNNFDLIAPENTFFLIRIVLPRKTREIKMSRSQRLLDRKCFQQKVWQILFQQSQFECFCL